MMPNKFVQYAGYFSSSSFNEINRQNDVSDKYKQAETAKVLAAMSRVRARYDAAGEDKEVVARVVEEEYNAVEEGAGYMAQFIGLPDKLDAALERVAVDRQALLDQAILTKPLPKIPVTIQSTDERQKKIIELLRQALAEVDRNEGTNDQFKKDRKHGLTKTINQQIEKIVNLNNDQKEKVDKFIEKLGGLASYRDPCQNRIATLAGHIDAIGAGKEDAVEAGEEDAVEAAEE